MNNIPRRAYTEKQEIVERLIHLSIEQVEKYGCAESLTLAVDHLQAALAIMSDFIDFQEE